MPKSIHALIAGSAAALCVAVGAVAIAQPAPPSGPDARHEHGMRHDPSARLRALLQLRPNQQPALDAFVGAVRPDHDREPGKAAMRMDGAPKTTPDRLAMMERKMAERDARTHARIEATRRFYAQLDPAQQRAFDALPMMMGRHGDHHGGWGGHGPMDGRRDHGGPPPAAGE